jgi:hypothetical protein
MRPEGPLPEDPHRKSELECLEEFVSNNERRVVPRKPYALPVKFSIVSEEFANDGVRETHYAAGGSRESLEAVPVPQLGETVNLSEGEILFKARHSVNIGDRVEMFFSLPTELAGRAIEEVKCSARVVHVGPRC